jgi:S-formylglutathione hydrolase FrmB
VAVNPVDELKRARYPSGAGLFAAGHDDIEFRSQARTAADEARGAGMSVGLVEFPGGHSWALATDALDRAVPWLASRGGILDPSLVSLPR